jgi:glycosyltransferase involved in cell wall biosynthesis
VPGNTDPVAKAASPARVLRYAPRRRKAALTEGSLVSAKAKEAPEAAHSALIGTTQSAGPGAEAATSLRRPGQLEPLPRPPSISALICAYTLGRWEATAEAVRSVARQTEPAKEIILVIDNNEELHRRAVRAFPDITVIPHSGPRGHAAGSNVGVAAATGDIVAFLDDDAQADADWLRQLRSAYEARPDALGIGGFLSPQWLSSRPPWLVDEFLWVVGCSYAGLPTRLGPVRNLIGANMSLRRDVLLAAGSFRDDLSRVGTRPFGAHETELCLRAGHLWPDWSFYHEPLAIAHHRVTADRTRLRYFLRHCHDEGRAKALLAHSSESPAALDTELRYATRQVPLAIGREIRAAARGSAKSGLAAASMAAALGCASVGYARVLLGRPKW